MVLRIADLLAERGMRKADLARRAGLTQSNLNSAINNGNPTIETLERIAKALEVEVYELLTDKLPSRTEGVVYMGELAYALVKVPGLLHLPTYAGTTTLDIEILRFVMECNVGRKTASMSGLAKGSQFFTIFYISDKGMERFLLSVWSRQDDVYTGVYVVDEYQKETDEETIQWNTFAITKELSHEILGVDRGRRLFNTCREA